MNYKKNDIVTIRIDDIADDGAGIGKIDGYTLFVKDAVIGDVAEAKITKLKKNYGYAILRKVIKPSQFRIKPRCALYRQCGGCQLQALSYERQLIFKNDKIKNNLIRIGGFDKETIERVTEPIVGMEEPWHYRNKAQYPVGYDKNGKLVTGFYAGRTHDIIPNTDCELGARENGLILNAVLSYMEENHVAAYDETTGSGLVRHILIRTGFASGEIMVCLVINAAKLPKEERLIKKLTEIRFEETDLKKFTEIKSEETDSNRYTETKSEETDSNRYTEIKSEETDSNRYTEIKSEESDSKKYTATRSEESDSKKYTATRFGEPDSKKPPERIVSISININTERNNVIMGKKVRTLWGKDYIEDSLRVMKPLQQADNGQSFETLNKALTFRISPLSFYQVNPRQTEKLYAIALDYAKLTGKETVWDLYCGIGTVSLFFAGFAKYVYGVEVIPQAVKDAKENARINGITNVEFYAGKAEEILPEKRKYEGISADVIVVDPPRKGCDIKCLETMLAMTPERIVYISCDSATLARDLKVLYAGGYGIARVRGVDQFGWSGHVETCVLLTHKKPTSYIEVTMDYDKIVPEYKSGRATYKMITDYVLEKYNLKVKSTTMAEVKRSFGLPVGDYNVKEEKTDYRKEKITPEKRKAVEEALRHFGVIE